MLSLNSLISPRAGMNIVKNAIEATINTDISDFDLIYHKVKNVVLFRLYDYYDDKGSYYKSKLFNYPDGVKLSSLIISMLKDNKADSNDLDIVVVSYSKMECKLYLNDKTTKIIEL